MHCLTCWTRFFQVFLQMILLLTGLAWHDPLQAAPPASAKPAATPENVEDNQPFQVRAAAAILGDVDTHTVMFAQDADLRLPPASLTKVMTLYLVYEALTKKELKLDDLLPVSEKAWRMSGSKTFLNVGDRVRVEDLILGIAVQSGNDACVVVAEHMAGSEEGFADLMNKKAKELGMTNSHFTNASGLPDPEHYTTARDLYLLASSFIFHFPKFAAYSSEKQYTFNGIRQYNRNRLLWRDPSITGLKTGHTNEAGYCLIASSEKDNQRLVAVILNTATRKIREEEAMRMLRYGNRMYETVRLYEAGSLVRKLRVWKGEREDVDATLQEAAVITVLRKDREKMEVGLVYDEPLIAPVSTGQTVGTLVVRLAGKEVLKQRVVAANEVPEAGFVKRMTDSLRLKMNW